MENKNNVVNEFIEGLEGVQREITEYFVNYMRENHSDLEEVISFQMPTYKLGSGKERNYVSISTAKNHYSLHTMDFEYIILLKEKLSKAGKGKGCVNVAYDNLEERDILFNAIEEIIKRKKLVIYGKNK